jgi:integrase
MEAIKTKILEVRPHLSKQSVSTYTSILKNLYTKVFGDNNFDINNFNNTTRILEFLHTLEPNKRKTVLSSLVILTDKKEYREQMLKDIQKYNEEQHKQEKSEKQNESWVEGDEIKKLINTYSKEVKLLYKKDASLAGTAPKGTALTDTDLQIIQNYIILCLLGGVYIPPRRSKDYVDFKIKNVDKTKDNYLNKNKLVFNSYKTAKTYGQQEVEIPEELLKILKKWIKVNPTEYLLFDSKKNKLSNVKLNQRLNKIFGDKKVGVNQLRHTYLSDKYQESIKVNNEMAEDFSKMGSSKAQEKIYIKKSNKVDDI